MKTANTLDLSLKAIRKYPQLFGNLDYYTGVVAQHAMARLAVKVGGDLIEESRAMLMPYVEGKRPFRCNFPNYCIGGNGTAYLLWQRHLPEAEKTVRWHAEEILNDAPKDRNGIICEPECKEEERIWIDVAFAITPFLIFAGRYFNEPRYLEEGFQQTAKMAAAFENPENGLFHQSRNVRGPGHISQDHWSRGNGWGAYALVEMACHLPDDHPRKKEAVALYLKHIEACAAFQNARGLWHQEMTEPHSYVETSGSGLMLYALGAGLEAGVIKDEASRKRFEKGVSGLLDYISEETDIYHTSCGLRSPGQGTKLEYMAQPPKVNDQHSFGAIALAMGQAYRLGIHQVNQMPWGKMDR